MPRAPHKPKPKPNRHTILKYNISMRGWLAVRIVLVILVYLSLIPVLYTAIWAIPISFVAAFVLVIAIPLVLMSEMASGYKSELHRRQLAIICQVIGDQHTSLLDSLEAIRKQQETNPPSPSTS